MLNFAVFPSGASFACVEIIVGVIAVLWIPAGLGGAATIYAITVRRHPESFLKLNGQNEFAFALMTCLGLFWFTVVVLALYLNPEYRGAGLLLPGKRAKQEAERLRVRYVTRMRIRRRQ